jgi:hypothetical protein
MLFFLMKFLIKSGEFGYVKDYIYKDKTGIEKTLHLKCRLYGKPYNCLGRARIGLPNTDVGLLKHTVIHNCESKEEEKVSIEAKGNMKRKAETTTSSLREIFEDELSQNEALSNILTFPQVASAMQRRRRMNLPPNPKNPKEAVEILESGSHPFQDIYLGHVTHENQVGVFIGDKEILKRCQGATKAFTDATFKIVPVMPPKQEKFYQWLIVQVELSPEENLDNSFSEDSLSGEESGSKYGHCVPVIGVLMTGKSGDLYRKVFEKIKELSLCLEPTEWMTDFETGLRNALQENWPESKINGCGFHFKNATGKWIRKNALFYDYRTNTVVKTWLRKVQFSIKILFLFFLLD